MLQLGIKTHGFPPLDLRLGELWKALLQRVKVEHPNPWRRQSRTRAHCVRICLVWLLRFELRAYEQRPNLVIWFCAFRLCNDQGLQPSIQCNLECKLDKLQSSFWSKRKRNQVGCAFSRPQDGGSLGLRRALGNAMTLVRREVSSCTPRFSLQ